MKTGLEGTEMVDEAEVVPASKKFACVEAQPGLLYKQQPFPNKGVSA